MYQTINIENEKGKKQLITQLRNFEIEYNME